MRRARHWRRRGGRRGNTVLQRSEDAVLAEQSVDVQDGICILALGSSTVLHFLHVSSGTTHEVWLLPHRDSCTCMCRAGNGCRHLVLTVLACCCTCTRAPMAMHMLAGSLAIVGELCVCWSSLAPCSNEARQHAWSFARVHVQVSIERG